jgi:hypothetical protein
LHGVGFPVEGLEKAQERFGIDVPLGLLAFAVTKRRTQSEQMFSAMRR